MSGSGTMIGFISPFAAPDAADHERLLTEETEDLDEYPDCGLPRHTRLMLLKGIILPTTVAMVEFIEHARPNDGMRQTKKEGA